MQQYKKLQKNKATGSEKGSLLLYSGTTLVKNAVRKLELWIFSFLTWYFFKAITWSVGSSSLWVNLSLHMLRYFQLFSAFHLNKLELSVLLFAEGGLFLSIDTFMFTMVSNENCTVCHWCCALVDQYLIISISVTQ